MVLQIYFICKTKFSFVLSICSLKYYVGQGNNVSFEFFAQYFSAVVVWMFKHSSLSSRAENNRILMLCSKLYFPDCHIHKRSSTTPKIFQHQSHKGSEQSSSSTSDVSYSKREKVMISSWVFTLFLHTLHIFFCSKFPWKPAIYAFIEIYLVSSV